MTSDLPFRPAYNIFLMKQEFGFINEELQFVIIKSEFELVDLHHRYS